MSILIKDATIITVDGSSRIWHRGAIFIEGARIVAVGPSDAVLKDHPGADRVIDGRGKVVAPGFVSTHNHVGYTLFRGRAEDAGLGCVLGMYLPMANVATREERRLVGSLTYAEMLKSGVTTTLEMEEEVDVYAEFVETLGCRSAMGVMLQDADVDAMRRGRYVFDAGMRERELKRATEFAETWHGRAGGRIQALITPNLTITSSPELLKSCRRQADRLGLRLSMHLGWGDDEFRIIRDLHGVSPYAYARDTGMLAEDTVMAHCYVTTDEDTGLLARSGACVSHCPLMNAVRGHIAPLVDYQARGIPVSLGIDNMFSDYFEVVRAAVMMARIKQHDAVAILAKDALRLATMGGARALGLDAEIGSLEAGKRADLMVLDYDAFGLRPTLDPVQNLVYHGHAKDVQTVLVDGAVVVDDGRLVHADAASLVTDAEQAAQAAWDRFVAKHGGIIAG
jgi:cytosine/adenosine deaminase-related metal-dependent hydrolase